jgi:hypothetical protein
MTVVRRVLTGSVLGLACLLPASSAPQAYAVAGNAKSFKVTVRGSPQWIDTGVDVKAGDKLHITAKGKVDFADKTGVGPDGAVRGWKDTLRALMVPSAGRGALVGQVGNDPAAIPFFIGAEGTVTVPVAGRLYLGINQSGSSLPRGKFQVHVERTAAPTGKATAGSAKYDFQPLFAVLQKDLPPRVSDKPGEGGNPGDLVNFVLVGDQEQITSALKAAGWVAADKTNEDAVLGAILATLNKEVYIAVPMSTLYLFGRPQDFGYARAQAVQVAAERDHFRIWQAPFKGPDGQTLWAGAGTHDIGIEPDERTPNGVTHKIDPDVDKERDFIGATLQQAGRVQAMDYMDRPNPITQAFTATGGEIKSDGRVLVIVLKPAEAAK